MSYPKLEQAMWLDQSGDQSMTRSEKDNLKKYRAIRARNLHKMEPIPVCNFD